ncbi:hypothetical protein TCAL_10951 [Tigriopus californicus]|uniref:ZP domain-containing protein n=1 Tax=Tigriopus californicus TaxID=6832 RepID=A0A553NEY9_TIGCA|nr:hypothetical protein TCAL_10951 [Tigriopus californicus]
MKNFICRSAEYNYVTLQCRLSDYDRRTVKEGLQAAELTPAQGVDYFENLCLQGNTACESERSYLVPKFGVPDQKVALHVGVHYYVDKELMVSTIIFLKLTAGFVDFQRKWFKIAPLEAPILLVVANSQQACGRACAIESEFLCRSYLYLGPPSGTDYNCKMYHMDHWTIPAGASAFVNSITPILNDGSRIGSYFENRCGHPTPLHYTPYVGSKQPKSLYTTMNDDNTMLCKRVVTADGRYITQITCYEKGEEEGQQMMQEVEEAEAGSDRQALRLPYFGSQGRNALTSLFQATRRQLGGNTDIDSGLNSNGGANNPDGSSDSSNSNSIGGGITNNNNGGLNGPFDGSNNDNSGSNNNLGAGSNQVDNPDVNCDGQGTCYDVTVHCKDTRIVVNVGTTRPFSGRIYALGRSETCNVDVINSNSFRLDLTMAGQECNTQSVNGVYTNTVVVQRHSVVMTKTDKIYKVRCTYDTSSKNITFGMMPIRDPDMISITSAPEAPAPRITILDQRQKEVETVRIGDRLTFKIEIPDKTPYGIFARSCVAMAKDSRSTFPIIDDNGCPVDPTIFPRFTPEGNALISNYEAFRFTESYGVIFQCNVKYCLGPCPPASCTYGRENFDSWGRKKREAAFLDDDSVDSQMRLSREIIVLDYGDEKTSPYEQDQERSFGQGNGTDYHATPLDWESHVNEAIFSKPLDLDSLDLSSCPTRSSVLGLAVTCALLVVIYICTIFCYCIRRAVSESSSKMGRDYLR